MISRRRILSRSVTDGQHDTNDAYQCEGDVWFNHDKFIEDHLQEVLNKWDQIDDEIWAKIICMERNHRVAKAYARSAILTINGSDHGFSDSHIGLNGFSSSRDKRVNFVKQYVRQGVRLKVEQSGDIIIERLNKSNVFVKSCESLNSSANNNNILLEYQKPVKLFDMKKFRCDVVQELNNSSYPDRKILERKCVSCVSFVQDSPQLLQTPIWCLVINILALDLLKSKLPIPKTDLTPAKVYKSQAPEHLNGKPRPVINYPDIGIDINNDSDNQCMNSSLQNSKIQLNNYQSNKFNQISDELYNMGIKARLPNFAKSRASFAFPIELKRSSKIEEMIEKGEGRFVNIKLENIFDRTIINGNQVRKFRIPSSALKPKRK